MHQKTVSTYAWVTLIALLGIGIGIKSTSSYPYPLRADLPDLRDRIVSVFHHPEPSWLDRMLRGY